MADKKITDLQLRADVDSDVNYPIDDGIQTYRVTAPQVRHFSQLVPIANKSSNYTLASADFTINVNATTGEKVMTLPLASDNPGKLFRIKKTDTSGNAVVLARTSTDLIDGETSQRIIAPYTAVELVSDGSNWFIY